MDVNLNSVLYKSSTDSGTVTFSADKDSDFITLGNGDFALTASTETGLTYNLDTGASATFELTSGKPFILDIDGTGGELAPVTFSSTGNATVIAHYGDSNIMLGGTFSFINDADSTTKLGFTLSDGSVATINGYAFTDAKEDGSETFVHFSNISDITIGGAFTSITSGTEATALTNVAFTLNDSTTAVLGAISVSDTGDNKASYLKFGSDSNTFTLSGAMSVSGTFANATFTLSDAAVYQINGKSYQSTLAGGAEANRLTFISDTINTTAFAHLDTSSLVTNVTGYSAGENIGVATGTAVTIDKGTAQLLDKYYFSAGKDDTASGTVTFSSTGMVLGGNLTVAGASGTELIGLNGESFTASAGTFFIGETGTTSVNSFTFTDASDGLVSELIFGGNGSNITLAGSMSASGTFANNSTFLLQEVGKYTINADTFTVGTSGTAGANTLTLINTSLTKADSHVFNITNSDVTGFNAGANILASSTSITEGAARLLGGYYFDGAGTVNFTSASDITLTGNLIVDAVGTGDSSTLLVGVSETNFLADAGTFYLADGGSATAINTLKFDEVNDGSVTKIVYSSKDSSMGVFGSVVLTAGSETQMTYSLNSATELADVSAITIGDVNYAGTGVR